MTAARTRPLSLARIRVVLVRPQHPGNIGAAARAMKNMGLADLVLVAATPPDMRAAAPMAVHARDVLAAHRRVATLADAIHDCGLVVGTSGRVGGDFQGESPRALAPAMVAASAANDVALVFGPEDHGLSNDELIHCHRVLTIPATGVYPSLNLAHAVVICGYELRLAAAAAEDVATRDARIAATDDAVTDAPEEASSAAARVLAPARLGEQMYAALEDALYAIGFLHRDNGVHMMRAFRRLLGRAALDAYETRVLFALARQIAWIAKVAGIVRPRAPHDRRRAAALTTETHQGS